MLKVIYYFLVTLKKTKVHALDNYEAVNGQCKSSLIFK